MNDGNPRGRSTRSIDGFRREYPSHTQSPARNSDPQTQAVETQQLPDIPSSHHVTSSPMADENPPREIPKRSNRKKMLTTIIFVIIGLFLLACAGLYGWYRYEISPLNSNDTKQQSFVIKAGATPHQISDGLENQHLIRSSTAFYIFLVATHQRDNLQAGSYMIAPSASVSDIVHKFTHGAVSDFSVTFYPGSTLNGTLRSEPKYSVTTQLKNAGYSPQQIRSALAAKYDESSLFAGKPTNSSLEGYIYGDTYTFSAGISAEQVIQRSLNELSSVVAQKNLVNLYKKQHLSLYQGITLASIVQREIDEGNGSSGPTLDQREVAQVFLLRLSKNMPLGSDVTYIYGAEKLGVTPAPDIDSPYNTRKYAGLPPGPIASPGLNALLAVANPAHTDYLYFLSGDDGKTYFSKTDEGHQQNIQNHCQKKCQY